MHNSIANVKGRMGQKSMAARRGGKQLVGRTKKFVLATDELAFFQKKGRPPSKSTDDELSRYRYQNGFAVTCVFATTIAIRRDP
jgi:hypothetical protein